MHRISTYGGFDLIFNVTTQFQLLLQKSVNLHSFLSTLQSLQMIFNITRNSLHINTLLAFAIQNWIFITRPSTREYHIIGISHQNQSAGLRTTVHLALGRLQTPLKYIYFRKG